MAVTERFCNYCGKGITYINRKARKEGTLLLPAGEGTKGVLQMLLSAISSIIAFILFIPIFFILWGAGIYVRQKAEQEKICRAGENYSKSHQ